MSLQPLRDFIVVSVAKEVEKKVGSIFVPTTVEEKVVTGTVLAAGSGHLTSTGEVTPLEVKAGDSVLFNKQMSVEIKHNGETVYLLREEHILSLVR